jgi:hypothetical protein
VRTNLPSPQGAPHDAADDTTVIDMRHTRPTVCFDGHQRREPAIDSSYATTAPKRFEAFQQTVVDAYGPLALTTEDVAAFRGRIRFASLGAVQLSEIRIADDLVVRRTPRLIYGRRSERRSTTRSLGCVQQSGVRVGPDQRYRRVVAE